MRTISPRFFATVIVFVFLVLGLAASPSIPAATITWDGPGSATGVWDIATTPNWAGPTTYAEGDDVVFNGSVVKFRNTTSTADITPSSVSPQTLQNTGGYGGRFAFIGGDIAGTATVSVGQDGALYFRRDGSYSFSGGINTNGASNNGGIYYEPQLSAGGTYQLGSGIINLNGRSFGFQPSLAATLDNDLVVGSSGATFYDNANADWSASTIQLGGNASITQYARMNGADFQLTGDRTISIRTRGDSYFYGTASGPYTLTLNLGYEGYSQYATLRGSLDYQVTTINKIGPNTTMRVAPNNWTTAFANVTGGVNINEGSFLPRNTADTANLSTLDLYFPLNINTNNGLASSVTAINVQNGGKLGGTDAITAAVTVNSGGLLRGSGTLTGNVGVNNGGTLSPGSSPAILTLNGNLTLQAGSTFAVELNGLTAGTDYDQLKVNGTVNLSGSTLQLSAGFTPPPEAAFIILDNDLSDAIVGTFAGMPEGAAFSVPGSGRGFIISYLGGDGNDLLLTMVPEPATLLLVALGGVLVLRQRRRI